MNYEHEHEWVVNGTTIRAVRGSIVVSKPDIRGIPGLQHTEIVKTYRDSLGISAQAQAVAEAQRRTIKLATEYAFSVGGPVPPTAHELHTALRNLFEWAGNVV